MNYIFDDFKCHYTHGWCHLTGDTCIFCFHQEQSKANSVMFVACRKMCRLSLLLFSECNSVSSLTTIYIYLFLTEMFASTPGHSQLNIDEADTYVLKPAIFPQTRQVFPFYLCILCKMLINN